MNNNLYITMYENLNSNKFSYSNILNLETILKKLISNDTSDIEEFIRNNVDNKQEFYFDFINLFTSVNNGYIIVKYFKVINIPSTYISIYVNKFNFEKISNGIYLHKNSLKDEFFNLQLKYKKVIYSHFTALYFHGLTELIPNIYTITTPRDYNVEIRKKYNVFVCSKDAFELGVTFVQSNFGNSIKIYDVERCICDLIKFRTKLDEEQVKKTLRVYIQRKDKDISKLRLYAKTLGIYDKVFDYLSIFL